MLNLAGESGRIVWWWWVSDMQKIIAVTPPSSTLSFQSGCRRPEPWPGLSGNCIKHLPSWCSPCNYTWVILSFSQRRFDGVSPLSPSKLKRRHCVEMCCLRQRLCPTSGPLRDSIARNWWTASGFRFFGRRWGPSFTLSTWGKCCKWIPAVTFVYASYFCTSVMVSLTSCLSHFNDDLYLEVKVYRLRG